MKAKVEKVRVAKAEADDCVSKIKEQFDAWEKEKAELEEQIKVLTEKAAALNAQLTSIHVVEVVPTDE
jgi:prefoldin subunit 5